ncbi:phage tail tape measure protein [Aureimonas altamirensis]|uniref:phage tail tape measure protein n=1 Tax=Aureimonas altamirensis TaxID=370622 RepID=UPI002036728A|nr:phage tail tape measure protein [Aureimonas altamirensis]MCM2506062.1 phage tail tape measure protein [Aureimonas altamirensis]
MSVAVTAPIVGFGVVSVKMAGDFEASMNRVEAASGATAVEMDALRKKALELGADTSKSASESADAIEMLVKNGVSASDILAGAADATIMLSEATGGDLSESADVATNAMAQFKIEAKDMIGVADEITGVVLNSQFTFNDYALALAQAGGVAAGVGVSFEDFNATIAATSSVFASGSDAGTSFKTFLTRLVPASDEAAGLMDKYNLSFFNANGSMKSMSEIAQILQDNLKGLNDETRNNVISTIFGTDAMRTAIALMDQGAEGVDNLTQKISETSATEQAEARMKGFNGELEKLSGAFETLQIAIASSGLLEFVTMLVTKLAGLVDYLGEANPAFLKWGTIIAAAAAAVGPLLVVLGSLATIVAGISAPVLAAVAAFAALGAAAVALYTNWESFKTSFPAVATVIQTVVESIKQYFLGLFEVGKQVFAGIVALLQGDFVGAFQAAQGAAQAWGDMLLNIINTFIPGFKEGVLQVIQTVKDMGQQMLAALRELPGQMLQIGKDIIQGLINGISSGKDMVVDAAKGVASSAVSGVKSLLGIHSPSRVMHEVGNNIVQGLNNGMGEMETQTESIASNIGQTISSAFSGVIDGSKSVGDAIKDVLSSLADLALNHVFQSLFSSGGAGGGKSGGGGIGGILSGLVGSLFGFARGGSFKVGSHNGMGGVDSQLVAFRASPNETVTVTKPNQAIGGRGTFAPNIIINNNASGHDARAETNSNGDISFFVDKINTRNMTTPGTDTFNALTQNYGARQTLTKRG